MREFRPNHVVIGVMGFFPLLTLAAAPSTQPAPELPISDVPIKTTDGMSTTTDDAKLHIPRPRNGQRNQPQVSPSEVTEALSFYQEHSKNRYNAIQSLHDSEFKTNVTDTATRYYLSLLKIKNQDLPLYNLSVQRVEVEDTIFGYVTQLRNEPADKQDPALQQELHDQVARLVDLGIQERQMRLNKLADTIKLEQEKLDTDKANPDKLIEERLKNIESERNGLLANPANPAGIPSPRNHGQPHDPVDGH